MRGAGSRDCLNSLKEYLRIHKPAIIAILETHISGKKADKVCNNIGFQGRYRVEARGFQRGIWVLWDTSELSLNILKAHLDLLRHKSAKGACNHGASRLYMLTHSHR